MVPSSEPPIALLNRVKFLSSVTLLLMIIAMLFG